MRMQKVCIVGDGLTGLTAALALSISGNYHVDLISKKKAGINTIDKRTTAISSSNFNFLSNLILKEDKKNFKPCRQIKLYYDKGEGYENFMNFENNNKNLMYIIENSKLKKGILKNIKKNRKKIRLINSDVKEINEKESYLIVKQKKTFYDLIILCLGNKSGLISQITGNRAIKSKMNEFAFTATINHNLKLDEPRQYFLAEGPLAILPYNKNKFSLIWSLDNKENKIDKLKNLTKFKLSKIFGNKKKINIENPAFFPIHTEIKKKIQKNNILILGESSHSVHPIAGQGFNLTLRDIKKLTTEMEKFSSLGIQIKNSTLLNQLELATKPENLFFGLGINFTHIFFKKLANNLLLKNMVFKDIDKFKNLKKIALNVSDRGIFT